MPRLFVSKLSRQLLLILSSIVLEYYQLTLFIVLAAEVSHDLLPPRGVEWQHLFSIAIFVLTGIARPLGGILFSGVGGSQQHHRLFYWVALAMSLTSIGVGLLPSYHEIGVVAPLVLIISRIFQGTLIGAALPEVLIFCYEKSPPTRRVLFTTLLNLAVSYGYLSAILFALLFTPWFHSESWRVGLVLCGGLNLLIGFLLRDAFLTHSAPVVLQYHSLRKVFAEYKLTMLRLICFATFLTSGTAVFFYVMPSFLREYYHYSARQVEISSIFSVGFFLVGLLLAVFFQRNIGRRFYISTGFIFKALLVLVFHTYVSHDIYEITVLNSFCCFVFGFFMAKLPVLIISAFPPNLRYAGVSSAYNISCGLMFAGSHYLVLWLIQLTHSLYMPSIYIIFFSYVSLISLWFMSKESFFGYTTPNE